MVNAAWPLLRENTFAARPVGARSITFCFKATMALTMAPATVVLPVPAAPHITITAWHSGSEAKRENTFTAISCSPVGFTPNAW